MFTAIRTLSLHQHLGPFQTFEELQAAIGRERPGSVAVYSNTGSGDIKGPQGQVIGGWSSPYQCAYPITVNVLTGPVDTFEELQFAVGKDAPWAALRAPNPKVDKHSGDVVDSQGNAIGKWTEK